MPGNYRKIDKIMLAVLLFTVSGAVLAYNLHTADDGTMAVSLTELLRPSASAVSDHAAAHILARDSVFTSAAPSMPPQENLLQKPQPRPYPLLEPIVRAP